MYEKIELAREQNKLKIIKAINELDTVNYETVSTLLPRLIAEGSLQLDHSIYIPADPSTVLPQGVGRYLVYDHNDQSNPFSIWAFAFAPQQQTPIHDHKFKGTVTVLEGPVSEKYYQPTGEKTARLVSRTDRYRFHSNRDELNDTFVHQLKRRKGLGEGISVTLHIYNMEAHFVNLEGEQMDQRNLNKIYCKDKSVDKESIPDYTEEHYDVSRLTL